MAALDFPSSPTIGQIYSANGRAWIWTGIVWNSYSTGIPTISASDGPPANAVPNQMWYESDTGKTFIFYDNFWVEFSAPPGVLDPPGTVTHTVAATAPSGWVILDGSTIVGGQTTYPALWAVLPAGMKSGANIVLPDCRGRALIGSGTGAGLAVRVHMGAGGEENHLLTSAELAQHSHLNQVGWGTGTESWPVWDGTANKGVYGLATRSGFNTEGGGAHNNMQPYLAMNTIMKL